MFFNKFTTPAKKEVKVGELYNNKFAELVKFVNNENYEYFFKELDIFIKTLVPDFDDLDFIEKIYVYATCCYFNVQPAIVVRHKTYGKQRISLVTIIDNIEKNYTKQKRVYKINDNYSVSYSLPRNFSVKDNKFDIQYLSAIDSIITADGREIVLTNEQRNTFINEIAPVILVDLEKDIINNTFKIIDIFEGVDRNSYKLPIISEGMLTLVTTLYSESFDSYYQKIYALGKHLRFSYTDYMRMTPREIDNLFEAYKQEQEEIKKEMEESKNKSNKKNGPH